LDGRGGRQSQRRLTSRVGKEFACIVIGGVVEVDLSESGDKLLLAPEQVARAIATVSIKKIFRCKLIPAIWYSIQL